MLSEICLGDLYWWSGYPCVVLSPGPHGIDPFLRSFSVFFLSGPVYNHVARMFPQQLDILEADANKLKRVSYPFKPRTIPT